MNTETVSRTIGQIIAPAVMVSACAILVGGLLTRYASINDRLRAMAHERLDLLAATGDKPPGTFATNRLSQLAYQVPNLLRRHKLLHNAITTVYLAMLIFILSMLLLGVAATTTNEGVAAAALYTFLGGTIVLAFALLLVVAEVRTSLQAVSYEVKQVFELKDV